MPDANTVPLIWDKETDVIVVGFGGAGAIAAVVAADAGAEVIILEKQSPAHHTPNTLMSAGGLHVADDVPAAARYFKAVAFGLGLPPGLGDPPQVYPQYPAEYVDELTSSWAEGVTQTHSFLKSLGPAKIKETLPAPAYPTFPGAAHYGVIAFEDWGIGLFKLLAGAVAARRLPVLWEHPAKSLIYNPGRAVIGVRVQSAQRSLNLKARRAVILATGGFACDEELKKAFLPGWGWTFIGNPGNTGDGLKMAMHAGAALSHMYHCAARVTAGGQIARDIGTGFNSRIGEPGRLLVDNYGQRYANELLTSRDPDRYNFYKQVTVYDTSRVEYPRIPSWLIFDEKVRKNGPVVLTFYGAHAAGIYKWSQDNSAEVQRGWILQGHSLEELAAKIAAHPDNHGRMPAAALAATVKRFNLICEKGVDPDFGRPAPTLGPLTNPPYYALAQYPGGPNTEGGLVKNARAQVINVFGQPIPRLYAAGEIASAWNFLYQAGGNLAECVIYGRLAGQNAARENPL